jgi:hypothetical protein
VLVAVTWMGAAAGMVAGTAAVGAMLWFGRREQRATRRRRKPAGFDVGGARVRVVEFEGYVYFDAAKRLLAEVTRELPAGPEGTSFLVLDLRGAIGAERSAAATLARLQRLLGARGVTVVFSGMSSSMQKLLGRAGCQFSGPNGHAAEDLRRGLEWCDLQGARHGSDARLIDRFQATTGDQWLLPQLLGRCEVRDLPAGAEVLRTGASDGSIHFVEHGTLSAWQDLGDGDRLLLRSLGPGALVREAILQPWADHPVVVTCDSPARVHRLSAEALARMEDEDPFLAAAIERLVTGMAEERATRRGSRRGRGIVQALNGGSYRRG